MQIDVVTLFPGMLEGMVGASIVGRARQAGICEIRLHDLRTWGEGRWRKVDDRPYGGGPGMVIRCEPVYRALEAVLQRPVGPGTPPVSQPPRTRALLLTPQGRRLDQPLVRELARAERLVLLCGRYEGFDERIRRGLGLEEVSIGDYVLAGGEAAAAVVIEAVVRLLPGALGHEGSAEDESFADGTLEYPQYTRPPVFRSMAVPEVLRSGDHQAVERWRRAQALERTRARRPDLLREGGADAGGRREVDDGGSEA
ncbi:MAG: tRNA (guanosine(37)-N1)-methyltransferase TrmD [Planctomycetota bacterium]|nr:MAG: tRNA (guanosine(37)-N1)-methyltransferase TrmD [Planctomycetota bacterium]